MSNLSMELNIYLNNGLPKEHPHIYMFYPSTSYIAKENRIGIGNSFFELRRREITRLHFFFFFSIFSTHIYIHHLYSLDPLSTYLICEWFPRIDYTCVPGNVCGRKCFWYRCICNGSNKIGRRDSDTQSRI